MHAHIHTFLWQVYTVFFLYISWNRDSAFSVFSTEWALRLVRMCVCFPFRELNRGVERHSLCLVLTSLEFKRPSGSLGCFSHHATCDSHYTLHIRHTHTYYYVHSHLLGNMGRLHEETACLWTQTHATLTMTQTFTGSHIHNNNIGHTRFGDDVIVCDVKTIWPLSSFSL